MAGGDESPRPDDVSRLPSAEEFAAESAALAAESVKLATLRSDIEKLHLRDWPPVDPRVHAVNRLVGVGDELGRLAVSFVLVAVFLFALTAISPWFWIVVAVFLGYLVFVVVWLRRHWRRSHQQQQRLTAR